MVPVTGDNFIGGLFDHSQGNAGNDTCPQADCVSPASGPAVQPSQEGVHQRHGCDGIEQVLYNTPEIIQQSDTLQMEYAGVGSPADPAPAVAKSSVQGLITTA